MAYTYFPNAHVIIDKYHFIRQTTWAIESTRTYRTWSKEILNAFKYPHITNGPTEGFNNKIKVLKRTSYGIRNFQRLRTRIFLVTN